MKIIENINFDNIHLFEVTIIGKPYNLHISFNDFIVIPVYKLVLYEGREDTVYYNSILIFEDVEYFKCTIDYYGISMKKISHRTKTEFTFNDKIPSSLKQFGGLGYFESGMGWSDMLIQFQKAHLLFDNCEIGYPPTNIMECISDHKLIEKLTYPNLKFIAEVIANKWDINASTPMPPKA
jgi:hypothetical protein